MDRRVIEHARQAAQRTLASLTLPPPTPEQIEGVRMYLGTEPTTTTERNAA